MKASALTVLAAATCLVASAYELSSSPSNMVTVGNITFFAANDGKNDVQLWRTDGTESGTVMVRDTERRIGPIFPNFGIVAVGNRVAFVASASPLGIGVWSSDGTEEGTQMLTGNFSAMNFGPVAGGALYFVTVSTSGMAQLWTSDGTAAGTLKLLDLGSPYDNPRLGTLGRAGTKVLFYADASTQGRSGIYVTDGTVNGTHFLRDIDARIPVPLGNVLLFLVPDFASKSWALWKTDGTESGTAIVRGGFVFKLNPPNPGYCFCAGDATTYFVADDGTGSAMWRTDGTSAGTFKISDVSPPDNALGSIIKAGIHIFFISTINGVRKLWVTDGTPTGAHLVLQSGFRGGGAPLGDMLLFAAYDPDHGTEVWRSDGTAAGTVLVKDIRTGPFDSLNYFEMRIRPGSVIFVADDGLHGFEPWLTDGSESGTRLLKNIAGDTANHRGRAVHH